MGEENIPLDKYGNETVYEVYKKHIVAPDDTSVLRSSSEHKVVTLITCHPEINPDSRLIVHAVVRE